MNRWLILFCAFLVFVSACKDDASKIDKLAAECATGNQEACKKLADIAKNDKEWSVRIAAVEKLTDQKLLADIAINDEDFSAREAAVYRLTDQSVLARIALEDLSLYDLAFKRLKDIASQDVVAADDKDWRVRLILKFISAFDSVPAEHRERLMMEVLPAIPNLSYPAVFSVAGDIVSFKTQWNSTSQLYTFGTMEGEIFNCSIKVQRLTEPLSHTWKTSFPLIALSSTFFEPARVNPADLLKKPFDKLTDQLVLAKIFKNNRDFYVRRAVLEKLTDQSALTYIAKNDLDNDVRMAAAEKLINKNIVQAVFADIARNDKDSDVRNAAERRLKELKGK